jgi:hypothetical protein
MRSMRFTIPGTDIDRPILSANQARCHTLLVPLVTVKTGIRCADCRRHEQQ